MNKKRFILLKMISYEINNKKNDMIHFHKINIFGDEGVGKTSFISFF